MGRRLGVIAVLCAVFATAAADPAAPKAAKAAGRAVQGSDSAGSGGASGGSADTGSAADSGSADDTQDRSAAAEQLPPHLTGPQHVELGNQISIDLPVGMILFEHDVAKKLLEAGGNPADNVLALIGSPTAAWALTVDYDAVGYVNDDDADKLDANDLLDNFKQGNREQNEKRKQMGLPELVLDGWSEQPRYERASHHLLWGLKAHDLNGNVINYFTRVLGRNGYMSIDLIDAPETLEKSKVDAQPVIAAIKFGTGARYEDHESNDKDSGIGLKTLILGGAGIAVVKAAKAGIIIKLLLVFKKLWFVVIGGIGGFFRWLFGKKKKGPDVAVAPSAEPPGGDGTPGSDTPPTETPPSNTPPSEPPASV